MELLKNIWEAIVSLLPGSGEAVADAAAEGAAEGADATQPSTWGETFRTVIYAVLIALGVRTVAYEPFNIPSESMLPTLLVGDYLFVSKLAYGYSKHSLPFSPPLFSGRIFESPVERGDVAVFKLPTDNSTDYIKRIIGVPGDNIQMRQGILYLNGQPVKRVRVKDFVHKRPGGNRHAIPTYRETLPNGVTSNNAGTRTDPARARRPRSLRKRSTIIKFSARFFSSAASAMARASSTSTSPEAGAVPFIGRATSWPARCEKNSSGEHDRIAAPSGSPMKAPYGTGWRARRRRYNAAGAPNAVMRRRYV